MTDASFAELERLQAWLIDRWAELLTAAGTSSQAEQERLETLSLVLDKAIYRLTVLNDQVSAALPHSNEARDADGRNVWVHVDASGARIGHLVAFQKTLSAMPGVARVSIISIDTERAYLEVELKDADSLG